MDPKKVEAIDKWLNPKNKKELQQFLGFANFYRQFIEGYSKVVKPLTKLTGNEMWKWDKEQQDAFNELKRLVCTNPVLMIPLDNAPFRVEVDASDYAIGGILSQKVDDKWRPVAYMSQALSETERNYEIYDKEMLAIMKGLAEWRQYLMGVKHKFEIWTDHRNLQYFRKPQDLNRRHASWIIDHTDYDFELIHKLGKTHLKPDILSRPPDLKKGENDNKNTILLKPWHF